MASGELNHSLVPLLVAGILSGSLSAAFLRPQIAGGPNPRAGSDTLAEPERVTVAESAPWIADLDPILDVLGAALVERPGESAEQIAIRTLVNTGQPAAESDDIRSALVTLRHGLDAAGSDVGACRALNGLTAAAATLARFVVTASDSDAKTGRYVAAKAVLDEYRGWRLLADLAGRVRNGTPGSRLSYHVDFIIATIPDYVDSNSGWLADQALGAIQSSMARSGYLLDRLRLIDWSRSSAKPGGPASLSRVHEHQPGALIFRKVEPPQGEAREDEPMHVPVQLQVVLLVLETPTAGVHHAALRNAASFIRAWRRCTGEPRRVLRVLGPTFSGSTPSLAIVLNEIRQEDRSFFQNTWVVSGSATADSNDETMRALAPEVKYFTTVLKSSALESQLATFLEHMNPHWTNGRHIALLTESNTAYGSDPTFRLMTHSTADDDCRRAIEQEGRPSSEEHSAFPCAKTFNFPLHIAQLWSDLAGTAPAPLFAPGPIVPLDMREAAPPSDQIPVLRPQLTSAVVASTVESILDAIRHEQLSAVGIVATDERDALFLAREVKRSTPDAQIFLYGTHALYLHPEYAPYLHGALIASPYSLALAPQPETIPWWRGDVREPFQSGSAEGVFHAARALLTLENNDAARLTYCDGQPQRDDPCIRTPRATISVIGGDGYWRLPGDSTTAGAATTTPSLPLLPLRAQVTTALIITVIGLHLIMLWLIRNDLRTRKNGARGRWSEATPIEWPIVQVFAPPQTVPGAATNHLLALRMCFLLLGLVASWVVATTLPFMIDVRSHGVMAGVVTLGALAATVIPAWVWSGESSRFADALCTIHDCAQARSQMTRVTRVLFMTVLATLVLFMGVTVTIVWQSATRDEGTLVLARYVGGGVVSPAAVTLLTMTALYVALVTGLRRLSLVGYGYSCLADQSAMFSLLTGPTAGERQERASSRLASILDMPAQHLPGPYVIAVCAVAILTSWYVFDSSAIDGLWFTYFLAVSAIAILSIGLLLVAQGLATWNIARSHLKRLVHSPIHARLETVAGYVPWDISLSPPRLTELIPVARMADGVAREFRRAACAMPLSTVGSQVRRSGDGLWTLSVAAVNDVPVRQDDLQGLCSLLTPSSHVEQLTTEMAQRQHAALIQSDSWYGMWKFSDVIVSVMQRSMWRRSDMPAHPARRSAIAETARHPSFHRANTSSVATAEASAPGERVEPEHTFLDRCEQLIALQVAFVLRDIVARTVTCLFSAMLCLTLLTTAHLLYSFNGRNTMLTLDMLAVAATALISVWILIDMERDAVLNRLRTTTAGRVNINWDFLRRIAVYGVVPLLVVLSSLFPEIGGTLFGWLEPLRKLSTL